jgi:hypothetical protein
MARNASPVPTAEWRMKKAATYGRTSRLMDAASRAWPQSHLTLYYYYMQPLERAVIVGVVGGRNGRFAGA